MDPQKRKSLEDLIGKDLADTLISQADEVTKEATRQHVAYKQAEPASFAEFVHGMRTKAAPTAPTTLAAPATSPDTSPVDDAIDTLDAFLETVTTDANQKTIAAHVNAFTAQLQKQLGATPTPAKLTDNGPTSVAPKTKSRRLPATFAEFLLPGVIR